MRRTSCHLHFHVFKPTSRLNSFYLIQTRQWFLILTSLLWTEFVSTKFSGLICCHQLFWDVKHGFLSYNPASLTCHFWCPKASIFHYPSSHSLNLRYLDWSLKGSGGINWQISSRFLFLWLFGFFFIFLGTYFSMCSKFSFHFCPR